MKDIQVFTALDAKTVAAEKLDILLLSTCLLYTSPSPRD